MIHKFSRYLLTLVALLAMTTGAWAEDSETITTDNDGQTTYTGQHFKITASLGCDEYGIILKDMSNTGKATIEALNGENITKIEMHMTWGGMYATKTTSTKGELVATDSDWNENENNISVININASSVEIGTECTAATYVQINKFVIYYGTAAGDVKVDISTDQTEASFAMPAYDATVSYQLVRDLAQGVAFSGIPEGDGCILKKDGDKYTFATTPEITLVDGIDPENLQPIATDGITLSVYPMVEVEGKWKADEDATPVALADFLASPQPGNWTIKAVAAEPSAYDGTFYSGMITLAEAYDLTLSPATDAHLKSVTVDGTAKTADEKGVIKNIEPTKKVKITTTGPDYIIRKATVKKTVKQ